MKKKPRRTFVLVADASRARLYLQTQGSAQISLLEEFAHPESRAKAKDLMADKPGRSFSSGGMTEARSAKEYRTDPKEVEFEKFARELGHRLASHWDAHAFEDLVIAAPPKFLGLLRAALATHHDGVSNRVVAWHEKDFTAVTDVRELSERLSLGEERAA
jgi:protein required for attachment to host cells